MIEPPKVTITGGVGSGKTTLAVLIQNALLDYGIYARITGSEDDIPLLVEKDWKARIENLKGATIDIATVQDVAVSTAEKAEVHISARLFDLVRYSRASLHQDELITDEEYAWLCAHAPLATSPKGGSPSRERLEEYDEIRARLKALSTLQQDRFDFKKMLAGLFDDGNANPHAGALMDSLTQEQRRVWSKFVASSDFEDPTTDVKEGESLVLLSYECDAFGSKGPARVELVGGPQGESVRVVTSYGSLDLIAASRDQWGVWLRIGHGIVGQEDETRSMLTGMIRCLEKMQEYCEFETLPPVQIAGQHPPAEPENLNPKPK